MEAKVLGIAGRVAGLAGLSLGVLLLIVLAFLRGPIGSGATLSQMQVYFGTLAALVFTFGIAGIGVLAWLVAPKTQKGPVPTSTVGLLAGLFLAVLLAAVFVGMQGGKATVVAFDNAPNRDELPSPPHSPSRPVDGRWDLQLLCPDTSAMNEFGAIFTHGLYARDFTGPLNGKTELAFGYVSEDTLKLSGYVFFDGRGSFAVEAIGKKSGAMLSGTGSFGQSTSCKLIGTEK